MNIRHGVDQLHLPPHVSSILMVHWGCLHRCSHMSQPPLNCWALFPGPMDGGCYHRHNYDLFFIYLYDGANFLEFVHSPLQMALGALGVEGFFGQGRREAYAVGPNCAGSIGIIP